VSSILNQSATEGGIGTRSPRKRAGLVATDAWRRLRFEFLLAVALLACIGTGQTQESTTHLRWKNGDVVPGKLLGSKAGQVRWSSPLFLDDLAVEEEALDSIIFRGQSVQSAEGFRVGTLSGDVFTADLIDSDQHSFLFSNQRFGPVRVSRDVIYALDRLSHPNLAFDASQSSFWGVAVREGPIKDLAYRIYDGSEEWPRWTKGEVPDVSRLIPVDDGVFAAGYLDLGLAELTDEFAMVFAGQLETTQEGDHTFELSSDDAAKLFVDGTLIGIGSSSRDVIGTLKLGVGFHSLRVEYVKNLPEAEPQLEVRWAGPGFSSQSLVGINPPPGWRRGLGGHLQTDRSKVSIFRGIELPESFEIDLEFTSTESPRFVLALGGDASNVAESPQPLRLETWDNELVLVQDRVFEPVMTIEENQHNVRLRLAFDGAAGELRVFDSVGRALLDLEGIQPTTGRSGLFIRNRGEDLTVRRMRVYRRPTQRAEQRVDLSKPRVHLMDEQIVYGHLYVEEDGATVVDEDETRRRIDLDEIDRIAGPDVKMTPPTDVAELTYADGAILRGRVEQAYSKRVVLRTAFSQTPVTCTLAGASSLRFESAAAAGDSAGGERDQLFFASGRLQGRLSFDLAASPISWRPDGAAKSVRIGMVGGARIERGGERVAESPSFDVGEFPRVLHLKNGEVIPCQVSSYDESTLGFQSPFIQRREMDSTHVKAIEFEPWQRTDPEDRPSSEADSWVRRIAGPDQDLSLGIDLIKLDRALTVPRFNRENPPSHILVAKTGDLKRGSLQGINGQTMQFESKLRKMIVPVNRIAGVVKVSKREDEPNGPTVQLDSTAETSRPEDTVRATLADGSVMVFEALESSADKLRGRSSIYGELAIPIESIRLLNFGDFEQETVRHVFEEWVVHPAKEPEFSKPSPLTDHSSSSEEPTAKSAVAPTPARKEALDLGHSLAVDTTVGRSSLAVSVNEPSAPDLGQVRLDPKGRSLRFPVSINQRSGLVEYALVTDEGKTHESVFRTDAEPTHIHLGLLLLGGTPSYARRLPASLSQQLPGEPVLIEIAWTEGGVEIVKPLGEFIVTTNNAATLVPEPWVYNGSVMNGNRLAAQTGGSIVSLRLDSGALINNPRPGRGNDELHRANSQAFPGDPTSFQMIVRVVRDQKRPANREESADPNLVHQSEHRDSP